MGSAVDGEWSAWHENGQLKKKGRCKSGREVGEWLEWHENGQLASRGEYVDGQAHGLAETWHENGQLASRCTYVGGLEEGVAESWHANGTLRSRFQMSGGEFTGIVRYWHSNGEPFRQAEAIDGELVGSLTEWYANGNMKEQRIVKDGKLRVFPKAWDEQGQPYFHEFFDECPCCGGQVWDTGFPIDNMHPCSACGFCIDLQEPMDRLAERAASWSVEPLARAGLPERFWAEARDMGIQGIDGLLQTGYADFSWREEKLVPPKGARGLLKKPSASERAAAVEALESKGLPDCQEDVLYAVCVCQRIRSRRPGLLARTVSKVLQMLRR